VIDQPGTSEQMDIPEPRSERQICRDVFLTSSINGAITLWDRRQERMIARLATGSRGAPPWCMSVIPLLPGYLMEGMLVIER